MDAIARFCNKKMSGQVNHPRSGGLYLTPHEMRKEALSQPKRT